MQKQVKHGDTGAETGFDFRWGAFYFNLVERPENGSDGTMGKKFVYEHV